MVFSNMPLLLLQCVRIASPLSTREHRLKAKPLLLPALLLVQTGLVFLFAKTDKKKEKKGALATV